MERLNKILARAGVASRRGADRLIVEGRVQVNGQVVTELGAQADLDHDAIRVDGKRLHAPEPLAYFALNKPAGYVTTLADPEERPTIASLLPARPRLFPVGRLDFQSEGLLLLTNDGELSRRLLQPESHVSKTYRVKVRGRPDAPTLERLQEGSIRLDGRKVRPARVRLVKSGRNSWLDVTLTEGRRQQVRRMFKIVGHPVARLRRVRFGPVELGALPSGATRRLTDDEIGALRRAGAAGRARST